MFIDAQGLPEPSDGMVYQVWSLKLSPLTHTSMSLLEDFNKEMVPEEGSHEIKYYEGCPKHLTKSS